MPLKKPIIEPPYSLKGLLMRFEDRYAILNIDGMEIKWPIKKLPDNIHPGETVTLVLKTQDLEKNEQYENMRALLEELVN